MHIVAVLLACISFPVALPAADGADLKALQGAWQLGDLVTKKGPAPADWVKEVKFTVEDDKLTMEGLDGKREFTIKLDPSAKPKAIDLTPLDGAFKGKTTQGVYVLDGDTLKLCMGNKGVNERPKEFKAGGESDLMCSHSSVPTDLPTPA